ncbi:MAG: thiamine diphosphokinase [Pararhodobacter sp.]
MSARYAKSTGITVVGGGALDAATLARALAVAPTLVAADGGADRALALGHCPARVIGDLDSLSAAARARLGADRVEHDGDQETTDFDKVLSVIEAPFVVAVGFAGARLDHTLAAMSTLARNTNRRVILDTGADLCLLCPPRLALDLPTGARVSLYPLAPLRCRSEGLVWPTDQLTFSPLGRIGTSNAATGGKVVLEPDAPALLALFEIRALTPLLAALRAAPPWPPDARAR